MHTKVWLETLKERNRSDYRDVDEKIILKHLYILKKIDKKA